MLLPKPMVIDAPFVRVMRTSTGELRVQGIARAVLGAPPSRDSGKPGGPFVLWDWDGARLKVENDPLGFRPLYYEASDRAIVVSPSLIRILEQGTTRDIDYRALSVFLRLGFFIGDDTPFRTIRALPPNTNLVWVPDEGPALHRRGLIRPPASSLSRQAAVLEYIDVFRASIKRRLPEGPFILPLSAGRDSRHILFELSALGYKPKLCITARRDPTQPSAVPDLGIAPRVAARLGIRHAVFNDSASLFDREVRTNVKLNLCVDEHAWSLGFYAYLNQRCNVVYDGIGGDVLSANSNVSADLLSILQMGDYEAAAEAVFQRWGKDTYLTEYLSPELTRLMPREAAVIHLAAELKMHADAVNPGVSFYFWNRTRREIALAPLSLLTRVADVHCPFLDLEVTNFLLSLPPQITIDGTFHTEALMNAFPQYCELPFEARTRTGVRSWAVYASRVRYFVDFVSFLAVERRDWLHRGGGMLVAALGSHLSSRYEDAARFLPTALYLLQLQTFAEENVTKALATFGCLLSPNFAEVGEQ